MEKVIEIEIIEMSLTEETKRFDVGAPTSEDTTRCWSPSGCLPPPPQEGEEELEVLEIT